jgi:multidrug transporter EmrE-like cation transporter
MSLFDLTALSLTEIVGDFGFREFAQTGLNKGFIQGIFGYVGVIFFLIRSLSGGNVMFVNGMWDGISGIIETLAAYFILGERFSSPMQYIGIAMIALGLFFLKTFGKSE